MSLEDKEITKRRGQGAVRVRADRAIVEIEARINEMSATDKDEAGKTIKIVWGEEVRVIDVLALLRQPVSVAQAAEDLAAIQTVISDATQAGTGRSGISLIRALLGV